MPRPIPAVVAGAAGAAALWSSSPSFVVPRNSEVGTAIRVEGRNGVGLSANMEGVSGSSLGLASVGTAVATLGLAAMRASQKKTQTRQSSSRIVCAAGNVGKKRCLVMGGTRFIGCYLVAKLREQGHDVVVCNRGKTNGGKPERLPGATDAEYQQMLQGVSVLMADRKDPASLKAALGSAGKFDIVFDNNVRKLNEVQPLVEGIQSTEGCEQFILMSSAGVYGPTDVLPLSEENPGDPNSRHKEKLQCEQYLDSQGLNWTSIRPVYIYGPLNYNPVERYFFDRVTRGRPVCIPYDGKYITQLGHCEDLADFMIKCIGNPAVKGQVYNISSEEYVTFDGMAKLCAQAAGMAEPQIVHYDPKSVEVPEGFPKAFPFRGMHFFASIEKAKRDVPEWTPKFSMLEGLKSSYQQDYLARGFDKQQPDFRTDELILSKTMSAA